MKTQTSLLAVSVLSLSAASLWAQPAITIYNNNFGVVRDTVPLDLKKGLNKVDYTGATSQLEPTSVVLRDPAGKVKLSLVEQSYRGDPVDERRLLQMFEGQTIRFSKATEGGREVIVSGKIVRAPSNSAPQPIIEVDGELRTSLPGTPLFPSLGDGSVLKPTLNWTLFAGEDAQLDAQLSYLTGGLSWVADYNLVMAEKGDDVVLAGLVSLTNRTGKVFEDAKLKLVAGDVNYIPPQSNFSRSREGVQYAMAATVMDSAPQVEAKKFDEFHMYTLPLSTTLYDQETKQVEFVNSPRVETKRLYIYNPLPNWSVYNRSGTITDPNFQPESSKEVSVYREFKNDKDNGLGVALPAGKMRFYRADSDGQLEFVGEDKIGHTPQDETIRLRLGNAFDIVGERTRTNFYKHPSQNLIRESFEIEIRNRSDETVTVQAIEPLYRWSNWKITENSGEYKKLNAQTIELPITVEAGKTAKVSYTVEYTW